MKQLKRQILAALTLCALLLASLGAATFAWFTNNAQVGTTRVTGRTATENVELLISSRGGSGFSGSREASITQVNRTQLTQLLPVSTADLETFVQCPATVGDYAVGFTKADGQQSYYHGQVFLKAVTTGASAGAKVALYLDERSEAGGALVTGDRGSLLLNAARLGLVFDGNASSAVILRLSEEKNADDQRKLNTKLNGVVLEEGKVLTWRNGAAAAAEDPSAALVDYTVGQDGRLPAQPLLVMELGRIYTVDVYFYLEGCDPDCTDAVAFDGGDLHLSFYGILN